MAEGPILPHRTVRVSLPELLDRPHTQGSCKNADNKEPLLGVLDGMNAERNDHDADTEFDGFAVIRHSVPFETRTPASLNLRD